MLILGSLLCEKPSALANHRQILYFKANDGRYQPVYISFRPISGEAVFPANYASWLKNKLPN